MSEQLSKLRPDRDLQCYFQMPSAVAALSQASPNGFRVSGCWRDPFDWVVVEWNRDNTFEHPALRNLPDGDLSGVRLSYQEVRTNCIPMDSTLYPTVEWPYLRIWAESNGSEALYLVPLQDPRLGYCVPCGGSYASATATFLLQGAPASGDCIELAWLDQHFNYSLTGTDTLQTAVAGLAEAINQFGNGTVSALGNGAEIQLSYVATAGANANRIGVYGTIHGTGTGSWSPSFALFQGGSSPTEWQVTLNFASLQGYIDPDRTQLVAVPTNSVRKMRWTWAADLQPGNFQRTEFSVVVSNWTVAGSNLLYQVAGPGSRRIEDDSAAIAYSAAGLWNSGIGNFSGGSIHWTTSNGASLRCCYTAGTDHMLCLGTRLASTGGHIAVLVDSNSPVPINLALPGEDVLVRLPLGQIPGGTHEVSITCDGANGSYFYFDYLEVAVPTANLPDFAVAATTTLATDWDTEHSLALAPERTAWLVQKLGFRGRANHYGGALWWFELVRPGQQFASAKITFSGSPEWGRITSISVGGTVIEHVNLVGETLQSLAICFAMLINAGSNSVWAQASDATVILTARRLGTAGNGLSVAATCANSADNPTPLMTETSGPALTGGIDGSVADPNWNFWRTDLTALPRINRAARDWNASFFSALKGYGIDVAASFSMELQFGDDTPAAGIAQRYPNGDAAWLTTPSLQTNFGPQSTAFWQQAYLDMATIMAQAGLVPYLQFGEVQWWYFPGPTATAVTEPGLPVYDAYTTAAFQSTFGRSMALIANQYANPSDLVSECSFLPGLIGAFTSAVRTFVKNGFPNARFEVLYPVDVNDTALNQAINFPAADWTPANLNCLKTENFTYTLERNLNQANSAIQWPIQRGFLPSRSSHLVGISDYTTPWMREQQSAIGAGLESVVLFALDQFCLIGYPVPLPRVVRRARFTGAR